MAKSIALMMSMTTAVMNMAWNEPIMTIESRNNKSRQRKLTVIARIMLRKGITQSAMQNSKMCNDEIMEMKHNVRKSNIRSGLEMASPIIMPNIKPTVSIETSTAMEK
jgi:hypothetical protein